MLALSWFVGLAGLCSAGLRAYAWKTKRPLSPLVRRTTSVFLGAATVLAGCLVFGTQFEPDWLQTTYQEVRTSALLSGTRLRIVQLSDLHVRGMTSLLEALPSRVNGLAPDVIVVTGDMAGSPDGLPALRETMRALHASEGIYAVKGNHDLAGWVPRNLFEGLATELNGQPISLRGGRLSLCGAGYDAGKRVASCLEQAPESGRIVAFHTPDLVEDLQRYKPILYMAGHTHGGQVRLPFYGALVTFSKFDKKYEMGRYTVGDTALYVNRGIGGTRLRFLCRPEITVIDVIGTG
jgi:predicted MPP superfamily phosphohydrolase